MKQVFEQNLSYKLVLRLSQQYPGSKHVKDVGLTGVDEAIWKLALDQAIHRRFPRH
ncbi:DUF5615 family PIN-like protein [Nitrospira sp. M1]